MIDPAQARTLAVYLARAVAEETLTLADLKAKSLEMFAKQIDGTTVVEVTIESGMTRALVNCDPATMHAALEAVIADLDPDNPLAGVDPSTRHSDLSRGRIET